MAVTISEDNARPAAALLTRRSPGQRKPGPQPNASGHGSGPKAPSGSAQHHGAGATALYGYPVPAGGGGGGWLASAEELIGCPGPGMPKGMPAARRSFERNQQSFQISLLLLTAAKSRAEDRKVTPSRQSRSCNGPGGGDRRATIDSGIRTSRPTRAKRVRRSATRRPGDCRSCATAPRPSTVRIRSTSGAGFPRPYAATRTGPRFVRALLTSCKGVSRRATAACCGC